MTEKLIFSCSTYYEVEDDNGKIKRIHGQADDPGLPGTPAKRGWTRLKKWER